MSSDVKQLHPKLQAKIIELKEIAKAAGIKIGTRECYRTVAEQEALYAKGRTKPGAIVTRARGLSFSSMHQWGVAFDFVVEMDCDKDGDIDIKDLYNNKLMTKVGKLGKKVKLEWGGEWKSIVDKPHFQLKNWGSTTTILKLKYGNFEKFKKSWKNYKGTYLTCKEVKVYNHIWKSRKCIEILQAGAFVTCKGEYDTRNGKTYLYVECENGKKGFVLKRGLLGGKKK